MGEMAEGLTAKQRAFVDAYLSCLNATEAARRAGYSEKTAHAIGWENLRKPEIEVEIKAGLAERSMSAEEVVARLADHARASADDFISIYESPLHDITGKPVLDTEGKPIVRYFPSLNIEKARERGMLHLVKKVAYTAHGPSVELYDAQAALTLLGKHHGLFVERHEHSWRDALKQQGYDPDSLKQQLVAAAVAALTSTDRSADERGDGGSTDAA
jgi:phage terminase small subunit